MAKTTKTTQPENFDALAEAINGAPDKRSRDASKRARKDAIKNARKRQEFFGFRSV